MEKTVISEMSSDMSPGLFSEESCAGFVPSQQVSELTLEMGSDIESLMIGLLPVASRFAKAPVSEFKVGAVALAGNKESSTGPGNLYFGANMEFRHQALPFTVHAEQAALNHAWLSGESSLQALAVSAAPCGFCRQFLYELGARASELEVLLPAEPHSSSATYTAFRLGELLPRAFGPGDLGVGGGLLELTRQRLSLSDSEDELVLAALDAANRSYAPYTKGYSGVALETEDGRIVAGRYAENAAFNPCLLPFQSAMSLLTMSTDPRETPIISRVALVEAADCRVSQHDATQALRNVLAPNSEFIYRTARTV
jgi:cytidine deaminase